MRQRSCTAPVVFSAILTLPSFFTEMPRRQRYSAAHPHFGVERSKSANVHLFAAARLRSSMSSLQSPPKPWERAGQPWRDGLSPPFSQCFFPPFSYVPTLNAPFLMLFAAGAATIQQSSSSSPATTSPRVAVSTPTATPSMQSPYSPYVAAPSAFSPAGYGVQVPLAPADHCGRATFDAQLTVFSSGHWQQHVRRRLQQLWCWRLWRWVWRRHVRPSLATRVPPRINFEYLSNAHRINFEYLSNAHRINFEYLSNAHRDAGTAVGACTVVMAAALWGVDMGDCKSRPAAFVLLLCCN